MKDFYDIWFMAITWIFDVASVRKAILSSFERVAIFREESLAKSLD
jgi:hypothetical protein